MSNLRVPFSVVAGLLFSSAVFLALYQLVSGPLNIGDPIKATVIEFTKQTVDTPVANKRDHKIERPPPPVVPKPQQTNVIVDGGAFGPTVFVRAKIELPPSRQNVGGGGTDRDIIPIVRVPPDYPARAQARGIEGWVQIQFAVTPTGTVREPVVVAAEPQGIFEDAALKAIARWRYNPRIDGGVAVERVGLQTVIRFELEK
ncbi:MAG: energy transducer TonB [Gammaproteobacteria bacterium]